MCVLFAYSASLAALRIRRDSMGTELSAPPLGSGLVRARARACVQHPAQITLGSADWMLMHKLGRRIMRIQLQLHEKGTVQ